MESPLTCTAGVVRVWFPRRQPLVQTLPPGDFSGKSLPRCFTHLWITHHNSTLLAQFECTHFPKGFPRDSAGKASACDVGDLGSLPGLGRSPGEGKGYPLQYSDLENSMDSIVLGVSKSQT